MLRFKSVARIVIRATRIALVVLLVILTPSLPLGSQVQAAAGDLDPTFGIGGKVVTDLDVQDLASTVLIQQDNKIIVAGSTRVPSDFAVVRYNPDGSIDSGFGVDGKVTTDFFGDVDEARTALLQPDGKIVLVGTAFSFIASPPGFVFALCRYNPDGTLDTTFGSGGKVAIDLVEQPGFEQSFAAVIQGDKIIAAGGASSNGPVEIVLARYNSDGSLDNTFGSGGRSLVKLPISIALPMSLILHEDNKLLLAGTSFPVSNFALASFNSDGGIDTTFGVNGLVITDFPGEFDFAEGIALQKDGKIVAAGTTSDTPIPAHAALARYNSDGSLDLSFGIGGMVVSDLTVSFDTAKAVALQQDGKIIISGSTIAGLLVARYNTNGSIDPTFGTGGAVIIPVGDLFTEGRSLAIQKDGKIVAVGSASFFAASPDFVVVRLNVANFDLCVQDDSSKSILQLNPDNGEYLFSACSGITIGGTGTLTRRGCTLTLQDNSSGRRVLAKIDSCQKKATVSIRLPSTGTTFTITDRNTANNTCGCVE